MQSSTSIDATKALYSGTTLDNCADEPIRIPGSIQPHGFLLGLDEQYRHVVVASENAAEFLRLPLKLILNAPVTSLLQREVLLAIEHQLCATLPDGMVSYLGSFSLHGEMFSLVTHCVEGKPMLEFERRDRLVGAEMMNSVITNFVSTLSQLETQEDLCEAVTRQVAVMTGFDRVLLYCFDEEGHGTVLSEANSGLLPSYLDLRFPGQRYTGAGARTLRAEHCPHHSQCDLHTLSAAPCGVCGAAHSRPVALGAALGFAHSP